MLRVSGFVSFYDLQYGILPTVWYFFFRLISLQLLLIRQEIINRIIITHVKRTQVKQVLFKKVDTNRQMDIITHIQIHATFSERVCDCYVTLAIS